MAVSSPCVSAVIVAAGSSTRFGRPGKVFAPLAGKPVLEWSLEAHERCPLVGEVVIVGQSPDRQRIWKLAGRSLRSTPWTFAPGGRDRQESVARGLRAAGGDFPLVSIHDAARPGVTASLIEQVALEAQRTGAAVAGYPARDTMKVCERDGTVIRTLDRRRLWQAATPQIFQAHLLYDAYEKAAAEGLTFTDDAGLVERMGYPVRMVPADETILKITTPNDLMALEGMLGTGAVRTGFGYDIHRTSPERRLVLGGAEFEEGAGLLGHSDADVVCHAAADALLGAAALGDIGRHFPDTDPELAGISSIVLLGRVAALLEEAGWRPYSLDVTLIAERPKIAPRAAEMRRRMAEALGLDEDAVSIKATTAEGVGAAGRGECMEAYAVAQIVPLRPAGRV